MTAEPRQIAVVRSHADLVDAMRARALVLNVSYSTLDEIAGLPVGYTSKLLGPRRDQRSAGRHMGPMSFDALLGALAMQLLPQECPEMLEKVRGRHTQANNAQRRSAFRIDLRLTRRFLRAIARKSADGRMRKMTPEQRSEVARNAAKARWKGHKRASDPGALANS